MQKFLIGLTVALTLTVAPKVNAQLNIYYCGPIPAPCPPAPCTVMTFMCDSGGVPPYTYLWLPGGQTTQNISNVCPGQYTITVTDAASATKSATVTVATYPYACSSTLDTIIYGNTTTLNAYHNTPNPPYSYSWTPTAGLSCISCSNPAAMPTTSTCYTATITDGIGCAYTCQLCVVVTQTGINENEINNFASISPNPFSTQTVLQTGNLLHNATLTVDNCFGQTVKQIKNINGQTITLSRDNLASGLYFVRLTADNKIYTDKLIITDK